MYDLLGTRAWRQCDITVRRWLKRCPNGRWCITIACNCNCTPSGEALPDFCCVASSLGTQLRSSSAVDWPHITTGQWQRLDSTFGEFIDDPGIVVSERVHLDSVPVNGLSSEIATSNAKQRRKGQRERRIILSLLELAQTPEYWKEHLQNTHYQDMLHIATLASQPEFWDGLDQQTVARNIEYAEQLTRCMGEAYDCAILASSAPEVPEVSQVRSYQRGCWNIRCRERSCECSSRSQESIQNQP